VLSFEAPGALLLLVAIPILAYVRRLSRRTRNFMPEPFSNWRAAYRGIGRNPLAFARVGAEALSYLGLASLVIALARPVAVVEQSQYLTRGADIVVALDVSPSMSARDLGQESRLDAARAVMTRFLRGLKNEAVGVVAFGREAALIVPPTPDYRAVAKGLAGLEVAGYGDGTAIGLGIAVACLHLRDSVAPKKSVILVTDGENNAGEVSPGTACDIAAELGIAVYVIGVGSRGDVPLEYVDPESGKLYSGTYRSGFDENALRDLADRTGGLYFPVRTASSLDPVFAKLAQEGSVDVRARTVVSARQLYLPFMIIAMAAIALAFGIETVFLGTLP
jgi:Ca-activated chloride channel homolog